MKLTNSNNDLGNDCLSKVNTHQQEYPLLGKIKQVDDSYKCFRSLSLAKDLYLNDHRFNEKVLFPGVMALELFAELANYVYPSKTIIGFKDVRFHSAIQIGQNDSTELIVTMQPEKNNQTTFDIKTLTNSNDNISKIEASLIFGELETKENESIASLKKFPFLNEEQLYQILPHGPRFHVLSEINQIPEEVVAIPTDYKGKKFFKWDFKEFTINPLIIEACFQTTGIQDFVLNGRTGLPSSIKHLKFYKHEDQPRYIISRKIGQEEKESIFDFLVLTKEGKIVLEGKEYRNRQAYLGDTAGILERLRSQRLRQLFDKPKKAWLEVIHRSLFLDKLSREPNYPKEFLHPEEQQYLETITETERNEWLMKEFAMKRAIRTMFKIRRMKKIRIQRDVIGRPFYKRLFRKVYFSVITTDKYILAMGGLNKRIGIALLPKKSQSGDTLNDILSTEEMKLLGDEIPNLSNEILPKIKTGKMAVRKAVGVQLHLGWHIYVLYDYQPDSMKFSVDVSVLPEVLLKELKISKNEILKYEVFIDENNEYLAAVSSRL